MRARKSLHTSNQIYIHIYTKGTITYAYLHTKEEEQNFHSVAFRILSHIERDV
jgi:hypothetical protein